MKSLRGNVFLSERYGLGVGFSSGFSFQYNLNDHLSFRSGLSFERKGSYVNVQATDDQGADLGRASYSFNYDYFIFHLLVRAGFGKKVRVFVNAGPYMGYLISREMVLKGDLFSPPRVSHEIAYSRNEDYGFTAGAGITVPFCENFLFSTEIRNNLGLFNTSSVRFRDNGSVKTNSFGLMLGVSYRMNPK